MENTQKNLQEWHLKFKLDKWIWDAWEDNNLLELKTMNQVKESYLIKLLVLFEIRRMSCSICFFIFPGSINPVHMRANH